MPVTFKDKNSKKHVFKDHAEFVSWLKKNRPEITDPNAFAAKIERSQSKDTKEFSHGELSTRSRIINRNIITGELMLLPDDKIAVTSVDIFLEGIDVPIITLQPEGTDFGVKFDYIIDSRARVGKYNVVWNILIDNASDRIVDSFFIGDDNIDRTLPLELQHLA